MIRPSESLLLAGTKLKTRKIRLIVTVGITSLLFGVLVFLASVTDGTIQSLTNFNREGYGGKFYIQAIPQTAIFGPGSEQEIIDTLKPVNDDIIARKKASAKKLNIPYDPASDQSLPLVTSSTGPSTTQTFLNYQSPLVEQAMNEKNRSIPGTKYEEFQKLARDVGATNTYRGTNQMMSIGGMKNEHVSVLIDGKEKVQTNMNEMMGPPDSKGVGSITSVGWRNSDPGLLKPFVLSGQTMVTGKDGSVPVIAPYSAAEEILGLKALSPTATSDEKLARLVEVRQQIAGKTAQLCYRNGASAQLFREASEQTKEIADNKGKKDYVAPALQYQLPSDPCGAVAIKSDKRSAEERKEAENKEKFETEFGTRQDPVQGIIIIRIIGINADVDYQANFSPTAVLTSLLSSSIGAGWVSPAPAVAANELVTTYQGGSIETAAPGKVDYFAEFKSFKDMERFIKDQSCDSIGMIGAPMGPLGPMPPVDMDPTAVISDCIKQGKVYMVMPYGNSAAAVEQFREGVWRFAKYAVLIIVTIAALIMMGNIGKIIADSRRETAVFRSLGAKRFDIAQIYLTYTVLISLLVSICALVLGSLAAMILNNRFTDDLSVAAVLAYNAQDVNKAFSLFGFNPLYISAIAGLILLAGLLSASVPLLSNMRRNPIQDMRDDS